MGMDDELAPKQMSAQLRAIGASRMSPLGFEITAEIEDEVVADPGRVPRRLQTPAWRDDLVTALRSGKVGERHKALVTLGGWDHDDAVAAALRPLVTSDDVAEVGLACTALARQGDITDLPAILAATHRLSPADGGTVEAMLDPLRGSLLLASQAGPEIVAGVKARAREWRGTPRSRRHDWQAPAEAALDELLAE
ncbi:MAG TPA: hypothetical protein VFY23_02480 [Candidatus Limnocylindrales bacterium]|nr:hypothetical protein [Candidatus Limnocylindrales bacterium]